MLHIVSLRVGKDSGGGGAFLLFFPGESASNGRKGFNKHNKEGKKIHYQMEAVSE